MLMIGRVYEVGSGDCIVPIAILSNPLHSFDEVAVIYIYANSNKQTVQTYNRNGKWLDGCDLTMNIVRELTKEESIVLLGGCNERLLNK